MINQRPFNDGGRRFADETRFAFNWVTAQMNLVQLNLVCVILTTSTELNLVQFSLTTSSSTSTKFRWSRLNGTWLKVKGFFYYYQVRVGPQLGQALGHQVRLGPRLDQPQVSDWGVQLSLFYYYQALAWLGCDNLISTGSQPNSV